MAYDEELAHRIREQLAEEDGLGELPMFGGLAFLLHGNMAVAISSRGELMVRVGPEGADDALSRPHARAAVMGSRAMRGWVVVASEGLARTRGLREWVRRGVAFARGLPPKG